MDRAVLETASDRYVIVEYLAEGGMGAIYLGKKLGVDGFEKEVVLKQLLPEYTREPKFIDLFLREARLSASLDHANVVRTVDLVNAGEDYFMVMEYVRGGDLRTLLRRARRRHKRFSPQAAVFIGHEILEALAYAHGKTGPDGRLLGLIHRDVSPSNILVSGAGEVKLTDFGIAKAGTHRSVFFKVKGKVGYMSPEQARGEGVDKRTDIFSLGVVLYEVLVGERLFVGDLMSSAAMIYSQRVVPPSKKRPEVPAEIDEVLLRALSLDKTRRFQSAEEMQDALGRAAAKNRLLCGASEMSAHLRDVCGPEPSQWLKLEALQQHPDESQAIKHGTAVLSAMEDSGSEYSPDPFAESEPHHTRAPLPVSAFKRELTSVIALRGDEVDIIEEQPAGRPSKSEVESAAVPLRPLSPQRSQPNAKVEGLTTPTPTPTAPFARERERSAPNSFEQEDSHASTIVRSSDSPRKGTQLPPQRDPPSSRRRSPTGEETLVRGGSGSSPMPASRPSSPTPPILAPPADNPPTRPITPPRSTGLPDPQAMRRGGGRRLLPIVIVLILIGVGVALGVAFSGPEIDMPAEVIDSPQSPR
jgi:serine/threonine-protein kinase